MTQPNNDTQTTLPTDTEMVFSRVFNAPRALVWKAWSQAEHLAQWWGPEGWTLPICEIDFRVGGKWFYGMQSPEGEMAYGGAIYHEIVAPERIALTDYFTDEHGNPNTDFVETHVIITFTETDGKTTMTYATRWNTPAERDAVMEMGMEEGFTQTLQRLDTLLSTLV
jgi:uncharacterized protein YndB with AHSA1/START domain